MIKVYFKTLFSNKSMVLIMLLCYALSFAALAYSYGYGKQVVYDLYGNAPLVVSSKAELTTDGAETLRKKMQDEGLKWNYSFMTPYGLAAYENELTYRNLSIFTDDNAEIILSEEEGEGITDGEKVTISGQEFTVVDISGKMTIVNYNWLPPKTAVFDILFFTMSEITLSDYNKLDTVIASFGGEFEYEKPPKLNILEGMMTQPTIILLLGIIILCLVTTVVMNFYIVQMRLGFFEVLMSLGLSRARALSYLLAEQLAIFIPMFIVGFCLYLLLHFFLIDIVAMLNILEIFLISLLFFLLLSVTVITNLLVIWRKKNV